MAIKIGNFNQKFVLYIFCVFCVCVFVLPYFFFLTDRHTQKATRKINKNVGKIFQLANIHPHNHRKSGLSSLSIKEKSLFIWPQKPSSFLFYSVWFYCNNNNNSSITSSSKSYNHGDKDNDQLSLNYAVCCWVCITF